MRKTRVRPLQRSLISGTHEPSGSARPQRDVAPHHADHDSGSADRQAAHEESPADVAAPEDQAPLGGAEVEQRQCHVDAQHARRAQEERVLSRDSQHAVVVRARDAHGHEAGQRDAEADRGPSDYDLDAVGGVVVRQHPREDAVDHGHEREHVVRKPLGQMLHHRDAP